MSLADVTNRCFQTGVGTKRWIRMCQLLTSRLQASLPGFELQTQLSNAILELFDSYPADRLLYSYLKHALHDSRLLSLPALVSSLLKTCKGSKLHDPATLDMLCQLIQDEHFSSRLPPQRSLLNSQDSSTPKVLDLVGDSLNLLRLCCGLPATAFHNPVSPASQLVMLLLSCVGDMTSVTTGQARSIFVEVNETLQLRFDEDLRTVLESFALSLGMILGDDAKMAQELQQTQSLQYSLGRGDVFGPNSPTDIVSCSFVLRHLVEHRTTSFGSGSSMAVSVLVATFRWTSWPPKTFYTQLFIGAISILAQNNKHCGNSLVWRSFVLTRLTQLLHDFEQVLGNESIHDSDWRGAVKAALLAVQARTDLLEQCDTLARSKSASIEGADSSSPLFSTLVQYWAHRTNLLDNSTRMIFRSIIRPSLNTLLSGDNPEGGTGLDAYIESRLVSNAVNEEALLAFVSRALEDIPNHPQFARILQKRVEFLCQQYDVDGLGTLCKVFNNLDLVMDVVTLHIRIDDLITYMLVFIEDFDCESVGDPQTALEFLGNVVLFLQAMFVKYHLASRAFSLRGRALSTDYLVSTSTVFRMSSLGPEDVTVVKTWSKALFDLSSEGIEDNILRSTKPKMLMKIAATLILQASNACADHRMESETLRNGVSYFTGPLLNWTLVGGIKALLRDILEKDFNALVHLEVLSTLVASPLCPRTVLSLTGHGILALLTDPKATLIENKIKNRFFKTANLRDIACKALSLPKDVTFVDGLKSLSVPSVHWLDLPRNSIRDFFNAARAGKAPALDVGKCVSVLGPTRFLRVLWDEVDTATQLGELELSRRLVTYVLLCPPSATAAGTGHSLPLLPIFFSGVLHGLLARFDSQAPTERTFSNELLVAIITSSLTGLLHLEWALRTLQADAQAERYGYEASVMVARRLALDLKGSRCRSAALVLQKLASSPSFVANFPMMAT